MWNKITGLVGPTGSGKSYEAAKIMGACERAAVYQIVRQDTNFLGVATDIFDGDMRSFCRALGQDSFRYIYRVGEGVKRVEGNKIVLPDFETFIACCFERQRMTMIVDEAHFLCSARFIPPNFWESIITGRHSYIDIVYLTQRFSMVHHDLTANTHEFIFWNITEPSDLDRIAERCGDDVRNKVANLKRAVDNRSVGGAYTPGESLVWNKSIGGYSSGETGSNSEGRKNNQVSTVPATSTNS